MLQTCKSCGTVFEIDEGLLSTNIKWLKCSVCNQKWNVSKEVNKDIDNDFIVFLLVPDYFASPIPGCKTNNAKASSQCEVERVAIYLLD